MIIGVSELQKKISIFKNLTETVHIIDRKSKHILATILPQKEIQTGSLTKSLGGILSSYKTVKKHAHTKEMIADAYEQEMMEKHAK